jgi:leader peptidase (prepilin peptidase)/N-methyltransferase
LAVGSFLDVVIERVPRRLPVFPLPPVTGPWTARLPLVSWVVARRGGGPPVSVRRPLVEVATAGLFAATGARFAGDWSLPAFLALAAVLVAVAVIDLEHYIVPNRLVRAGLLLGVPLLALAALGEGEGGALGRALLSSLGAAVAMLVIHLVQPRGMGMGDVKLALVLGLHLGWLGVDHVVLGLFLGFLLGAVVGLLLIALRLRGRKDHVPFAPFLVAGALLAVLVGEPLLDWYQGS